MDVVVSPPGDHRYVNGPVPPEVIEIEGDDNLYERELNYDNEV